LLTRSAFDSGSRPRCSPTTLNARERSLFIVVCDDVLTKLRSKRFEDVPEVPDEREIAQDGVTPLREIVGGNEREKAN
jgi:hypothetical protein